MTISKYKKKLLQDTFNSRVAYVPHHDDSTKMTCDHCDDRMVFALSVGDTTFSIGISTILECLHMATTEGAVPELPESWWIDACNANNMHGLV